MARRLRCPKCGSEKTRFVRYSFDYYKKEELPSEEDIEEGFDKLEEEKREPIRWDTVKYDDEGYRLFPHRIYKCKSCGNVWDRTQELEDIESEKWSAQMERMK